MYMKKKTIEPEDFELKNKLKGILKTLRKYYTKKVVYEMVKELGVAKSYFGFNMIIQICRDKKQAITEKRREEYRLLIERLPILLNRLHKTIENEVKQ